DNDVARSAEQVAANFCSSSSLAVRYCCEPEQNIALARNRGVQNADGDYIAFIDDDEFPNETWLSALLEAQQKFQVAGVLGPVKPYFERRPPDWVKQGKFFDRPTYATGYE